MDLIYELLWYVLAASLGGTVTGKKSTSKYLLYILDRIISTYGVDVIFQCLIFYFNKVI